MGNFQTKIFHAQSDHATNQYAADLIAQGYTYMGSFNSSNSGQQQSSASAGGSQQLQYKVLPADFTTLRKGGPQNGNQVEAIVFQGGRVWEASRDTFLPVTFTQV